MKYKYTLLGRAWIHDYVKAKAAARKERDPNHTISQEFDELIIAGVKALYGDELTLLKPETSTQEAPAHEQ